MEPTVEEDEDYDYDQNDDLNNRNIKQQSVNELNGEDKRDQFERTVQDKNEADKNLDHNNQNSPDYDDKEVTSDHKDELSDKYDDISKYQNLKYENNKNYEIQPNTYELIDETDNEDKKSTDNSNDSTEDVRPKEKIKFVNYQADKQLKPKRKNQVKLIKEIKYPKTAVARPKYYYPGRNFVHQRPSSKKDRKLSKIKVKSNKFVNDDLATLIPVELYKHQVRSRFVSNSDFSSDRRSGRLEELEVPSILNGELYCDCGFYLKLKNKKINKLNSKLKRVSNEQRQMRRKLVEMAVKENQLQLICRSQSKANLKYINTSDGRPGYLALSNATSQSNPIDLI